MTDNHPEKIRRWERAAEICGFVMSFISLCFTVRLMRTFATDTPEYWLYTGFGATVQIAQAVLFVYAVYLNRSNQNGKALTAFVLFCLLFVLSLAGTLGSFIVSNKVQNNQEFTQDERLKDMQARAKSLDKQIEASQRLISSYASKKIMTKGAIPEGKRLDSLNADREKLSADMANYKTEGTSDSLYVGLSKLIGGEPESIKVSLFALYAIALDLVSAVLLAFSIGLFERASEGVPERFPEPAKQPETAPKTSIIQKTAPAMQTVKMTPETATLQNLEFSSVSSPVQSAEPKKQHIGFTAKSESVENEGSGKVSPAEIRRYVEAAYHGEQHPPKLLGRRAIVDRIGISNEHSDYIHSLLKRRRVVAVNGNSTVPLVPFDAALKAVC